MRASALLRLAEAEGGFGMVLQKGESERGPIVVILLEKGGNPTILERILQPDGNYAWGKSGPPDAANPEMLQKFLDRRRKYDPDLWLIELDIASAERFAAEMNAVD